MCRCIEPEAVRRARMCLVVRRRASLRVQGCMCAVVFKRAVHWVQGFLEDSGMCDGSV